MKTKIIIPLIIAAVVLSGCNSTIHKPIAGVITFEGYPIGTIAPDIPLISIEGKRTSFRKVSQPIAILAFTSSSGEGCCRLVPELVTLPYGFRKKPIGTQLPFIN